MTAKTSRRPKKQAEPTRERGRPWFKYTMNPGKENQTSFHVFTVPTEKGGGFHSFAVSKEVRILRHWPGVYRGR